MEVSDTSEQSRQPMTNQSSSISANNSATYQRQSEGEELQAHSFGSFFDILCTIAQRKRLVGIVTIVAFAVGILAGFALPKRYKASTTLMPPQSGPSSASLIMNQLSNSGAGSLALAAGAGIGLKNPNDIYVDMLKSRLVADALISKFRLVDEYRSSDLTGARETLASNSSIMSSKSGLIVISVTDKSKTRAAELANEYTEQLRSLTKALAASEASQRRSFYEEQLKYAKDALVSSELAFQQVQQKKGVIQLDAQARSTIEALGRLRAQITAKEIEIQALRLSSTESNPVVLRAEQELSAMREQKAKQEAQQSSGAAHTDIGLRDIPSAGLEFLSAQHEVAYRQTLFDLLIKQYDAAKIDEARNGVTIQVMEPAIAPERKAFPRRAIIAELCAFSGFLIACFYVVLAEYISTNPSLLDSLSKLRLALVGKR